MFSSNQAVTRPSHTSFTLRLKNGKTTTFLYAQASTPIVALKADLFEALHEHSRKHTLSLAGGLPESPDEIVLGATAAAPTAASDGDGKNAARKWYPLDGQDGKKATVKDVGISDGDTLAWSTNKKKFDVEEMEVIDDGMGTE